MQESICAKCESRCSCSSVILYQQKSSRPSKKSEEEEDKDDKFFKELLNAEESTRATFF